MGLNSFIETWETKAAICDDNTAWRGNPVALDQHVVDGANQVFIPSPYRRSGHSFGWTTQYLKNRENAVDECQPMFLSLANAFARFVGTRDKAILHRDYHRWQ